MKDKFSGNLIRRGASKLFRNGILLFSTFLIVGTFTGYDNKAVQADANNVSASQSGADGTTIPINQDNFLKYFELAGASSYDAKTGIVTLIPRTNSKDSGIAYLKSNMDMSKSFSMGGAIQVIPSDPNDQTRGFGDDMTFAFRPGDPTKVGNFGQGIGVGGIEGAFGTVIDTYYNNWNQGGRSLMDPVHSPYISFFKNIDKSGIGKSDPTDRIPNSTISKSVIGTPQTFRYSDFGKGEIDFEKDEIWLPFSISYDGNTKEMTYSLTVGDKILTSTNNFSAEIPTTDPYMNFAMAGAGDLAAGSQNVKVSSINYSVVGVVNVHYLDADTGQEITGVPVETLKGALNTNATINPQIDRLKQMGYRLDRIVAPTTYNYDKNTLPFGGGTELSELPYQDVLQNVQFFFKKDIEKRLSIKVVHVDADNQDKPIGIDDEISGDFGQVVTIPKQAIEGYTPDSANPMTYKLGSLNQDGQTTTQIVLKYHKEDSGTATPGPASSSSSDRSGISNSSSVVSSSSSSTGSSSAKPVASSSAGNSSATTPSNDSSSGSMTSTGSSSTQMTGSSTAPNASSSTINTSTGSDINSTLPKYVAAKNTAVYSLNNIYLYKKADFNSKERLANYVKKPRIYRPMFVVTGYSRSMTGKLRYEVRDVNHLSSTAGKKGYITANWNYVCPVYYATKHSTITVISPRGVNAYRKANLTNKVANYRQGSVLRIKGIVKHNLTTRYVLTTGKYVTANRKLVNMGRHKQVKFIRTKHTINRYGNVNLTKRNRSIAKNKTVKVYGYDYSYGHDVIKHGMLRYHVAGGYITANTKYIHVLK
ncbi:lectin-like domain-containing protein [Lentilactobacillus hilgardii]|uniref:lectin-like domain-containing protein n=1 Tax=Lentilactobacillus hilgardii TaxID=1588 RepID=UPI0021A6E955|nr:DUF5776 domain-containing protein [Lentilactobacillus hilgardii]